MSPALTSSALPLVTVTVSAGSKQCDAGEKETIAVDEKPQQQTHNRHDPMHKSPSMPFPHFCAQQC
jgi:hypothetical protein